MKGFPAVHRILVLGLLAAAFAPSAHAADYGNVVPVTMPAPKANQIVLSRVTIGMELSRRISPSPASIGRLTVRRAGRPAARGYAVSAVSTRRGRRVTVRLVAVRTGTRSVRRLRLKLRVGTARAAFTGARTRTVAFSPDARVKRVAECGVIGSEAARWKPVAGLAGLRLGGERFGARATVGAAQQVACGKSIPAVPAGAAERFLIAVDPGFAGRPGAPVEGYFATWARGEDGSARICVFVRGDAGGTGNVTVGTTTQPFTLDEERGVALTQTAVPGEGEYAFSVRWRQPNGSFRETEGTLSVPGGGVRGDEPPAPYSAAGSCA